MVCIRTSIYMYHMFRKSGYTMSDAVSTKRSDM